MPRKNPNWINIGHNEDKPICPYCNTDYGDGAIFSVKNYPADGGAVLFLKCENCNEEAYINFDWTQLQKEGEYLTYIKKRK